jgi:hypothetical protein
MWKLKSFSFFSQLDILIINIQVSSSPEPKEKEPAVTDS